MHSLQAVLFDLDGTLADTAPDLVAALNRLLLAEGRAALPYAQVRSWVSHGGRYMIRHGFALDDADPRVTPLWQRFVDDYAAHIAEHTRLFAGMETVLEHLESNGLAWGIVTNKPAWLTNPLLQEMGLSQRTGCAISSDSLVAKKPHPLPLLYACQLLQVQPAQALYVGDAQRDIEAGQRAGTRTAVALFGYIGEQDAPTSWGADYCLEKAETILELL